MANLQARLLAAQREGDLTLADLSHWFDVPFSSVRYWLTVASSDWAPRGPRGRTIIKRIKLLEWAVANRIGMPVPEMMSARDRPAHMRGTRDAVANAGVLREDAA